MECGRVWLIDLSVLHTFIMARSEKHQKKGDDRMKGRIVIGVMTALLGFVVMSSGIALAEEQEANNMEIVRDKLRADKKLFVAESMGLTESEAKAFWPIYDDYQKALAGLGDRKIKIIKDYAAVHKSMSNETAKALLDDYLALEADFQKLRFDYLPKFRGALPDIKVARYYQLENKIHAVVNFELAETIPLIE